MNVTQQDPAVRASVLRELKRSWKDSARADVLVCPGASGTAFELGPEVINWLIAASVPALYGAIPAASSPEAFSEELVEGLTAVREDGRQTLSLLRAEYSTALSSLREKAAARDTLDVYAPLRRFDKPGTLEESATAEICQLLAECFAAALVPSRYRSHPPLVILMGSLEKLDHAILDLLGNFVWVAKHRKGLDVRLLLASPNKPNLGAVRSRLGKGFQLTISEISSPAQGETKATRGGPAPSSAQPLLPLPRILRRAEIQERKWLACSCFLPVPTRDYFELLLGRDDGRAAFSALRRLTSSPPYPPDEFSLPLPPLPAEQLRNELHSEDPLLYDRLQVREGKLRQIQEHVPLFEHRQALILLSLFHSFTFSLIDTLYPRQASSLIRFVENNTHYFSAVHGCYRLLHPFQELFSPALSWLSPNDFKQQQALLSEAWREEYSRLQNELKWLYSLAEEKEATRKELEEKIRATGTRLQRVKHSFARQPRPSRNNADNKGKWARMNLLLVRGVQVIGILLLYLGIFVRDVFFLVLLSISCLIVVTGFPLSKPRTKLVPRTDSKEPSADRPPAVTVPRSVRLANVYYENLINQSRTLTVAIRDITHNIDQLEARLEEPFLLEVPPPKR